MVRYRNCAVTDCEDSTSPRRRFSNPSKKLELFMVWVKSCCRETLTTLSPDLIYRSLRICHISFAIEDRMTNNFLKPDAVPKLFLPASHIESANIEDILSTDHLSLRNKSSFIMATEES